MSQKYLSLPDLIIDVAPTASTQYSYLRYERSPTNLTLRAL